MDRFRVPGCNPGRTQRQEADAAGFRESINLSILIIVFVDGWITGRHLTNFF